MQCDLAWLKNDILLLCWIARSWKAAAASYLDVGGQLLSQLQSEEGAVLTEQLLTEVAVAREALEKADAAYNTALNKLEVCQSAADAVSQKTLTCPVLYPVLAQSIDGKHDECHTVKCACQQPGIGFGQHMRVVVSTAGTADQFSSASSKATA